MKINKNVSIIVAMMIALGAVGSAPVEVDFADADAAAAPAPAAATAPAQRRRAMFDKAVVVGMPETRADGRGRVSTRRLLRAEGRHPLIAEEIVRDEPDADGAEGAVREYRAMVADHVIVRAKPGKNRAQIAAALARNGGGLKLRRALSAPGFYLVETKSAGFAGLEEAVSELRGGGADDVVESVEMDSIIFEDAALPNDTHFAAYQYNLHNTGQSGGTPDADIDAPEAWERAANPLAIPVVAVIDTGVALAHPDLAANIWQNPGETGVDAAGKDKRSNGVDDDNNGYIDDWRGWDFFNGDNDPSDDRGHGTHCSGIIGAVANNGAGIAGVAPNVRILPLKFLGADGTGWTSDLLDAAQYAVKKGARILSCSFGSPVSSPALSMIIQSASASTLVVAAAGNDSTNNDLVPQYPSSYTHANVISVASSDRNDAHAATSNYGAVSVDLHAPGVSIYSTYINNSYASMSGTSMAAPHVAGVAALLWSAHPGASVGDVRNAILQGADPVSALAGRTATGARLNAHGALNKLAPNSSALTVASTTPAAGSVVTEPPVDFYVTFSDEVYHANQYAEQGFTVNGIPAYSCHMTGSSGIRFHYNVSPVTQRGVQNIALAAGIVPRASDREPNQPHTFQFQYDFPPLTVASTTPAAGSVVASTPPVDFYVTFSDEIHHANQYAEQGFTVNGIPAFSCYMTGASGIRFHYENSPVTQDGVQTVELAADIAPRASDGEPSQPHAYQFRYDSLPMQALAISPPAGTLAEAPSEIRVVFNEAPSPESIKPSALMLSAGTVLSASFESPSTVVFKVSIPFFDGDVSATIVAGSLKDAHGNPLPAAIRWQYALKLAVKDFASKWTRRGTGGASFFTNTASGTLNPLENTVSYRLRLAESARIWASIRGEDSPVIRLKTPSGDVAGISDSHAFAGGDPALRQLAILNVEALEAGDYLLELGAEESGRLGDYSLAVAVNGALSREDTLGIRNDTLADAEDLDALWQPQTKGFRRLAFSATLRTNITQTSQAPLYDVSFSTPPHTVGQTPALTPTGAGPRHGISSLTFGSSPTVVPSFATIPSQCVELDVEDMLRFDLGPKHGKFPTPHQACEISFDAMLPAGMEEFVVLADAPSILRVDFTGDGLITFYAPPLKTVQIGTYAQGQKFNFKMFVDLPAKQCSFWKDGVLLATCPAPSATEFSSFRISTLYNKGAAAGVDNIVINEVNTQTTTFPETDYYKFSLSGGAPLSISTDTRACSSDAPSMRLFASDGATILGEYANARGVRMGRIAVDNPPEGRVFLEVEGDCETVGIGIAEGAVFSTQFGYFEDPAPLGAASMALGRAGDADDTGNCFSINLASGRCVRVSALTRGDPSGAALPPNTLVPKLDILSPGGATLASGSDTLEYESASDAAHHIRVSAHTGAGDYELRLDSLDPRIAISPRLDNLLLDIPRATVENLVISNAGFRPLAYQLSAPAPVSPGTALINATNPTDLTGELAPNASRQIPLEFDGAALRPGDYASAELLATSNDPAAPELTIPLAFGIAPSAPQLAPQPEYTLGHYNEIHLAASGEGATRHIYESEPPAPRADRTFGPLADATHYAYRAAAVTDFPFGSATSAWSSAATTTQLHPQSDYDNDGYANWREIAADTDPSDPASLLRLTSFALTNGRVHVAWQGGVLATQILEAAQTLAPGAVWQGLHTNTPPTSKTGEIKFPAPANTDALFLRIRAMR